MSLICIKDNTLLSHKTKAKLVFFYCGPALTLLADIGGRDTGEWQTVPQNTERIVLLEAPVEVLEVAFS